MEAINANAQKQGCKSIPVGRTLLLKKNKKKTCPANYISNKIGHEIIGNIDYFSILFDLNPAWTVLSTIEDGIILDANSAFFKGTGYIEDEVLGRSSIELGIWPEPNIRAYYLKQLIEKHKLSFVPLKMRLKNGVLRESLASAQLVEVKDKIYILGVIVDITDQKALEDSLINREHQLENVLEKIHDLETTIRVIGNAWNREKTAFYKCIENNINTNVLPHIKRIKASTNLRYIRSFIKVLEENLVNLTHAFSGGIPGNIETFTPTESQVIHLIKQGKSSQEIAQIVNVSTKAISYHRSNIRKKLKIVNKKINLTTYLSNIYRVSNCYSGESKDP